jgi:hypothetical protein
VILGIAVFMAFFCPKAAPEEIKMLASMIIAFFK